MATSGRTGLLFVGLLVGSTLGCSRPVPGAEKAQEPPREAAASAVSPVPFPASPLRTFCTVGLPGSWKAAFQQGVVPIPGDARMVPFTVSDDGSRLFAAYYSPSWSGVVSVVPQTAAITRIRAFARPDADQVGGGSFDGRYLAWVESHSLRDWNDWTLRAWDSRRRQVFDVSESPRRGGELVQGPIVIPAVSNGLLGWVQANAEGRGEAHLYSLADRRDRILSSGAAGPPLTFWGSKVIWQEIDIPGQHGHLVMASAPGGKRLDVPEPLASVHHLAYLVASDDQVAWSDGFSIWTWRTGEKQAHQIVGGAGERPQFLAVAGGLISWDDTEGPAVADPRSGSVARLTEHYGGRFAHGRALLVFHPVGGKLGEGMRLQTEVVDASSLPPLSTCGP